MDRQTGGVTESSYPTVLCTATHGKNEVLNGDDIDKIYKNIPRRAYQ